MEMRPGVSSVGGKRQRRQQMTELEDYFKQIKMWDGTEHRKGKRKSRMEYMRVSSMGSGNEPHNTQVSRT